MRKDFCRAVVVVCLLLTASFTLAAQVPIGVFPDPAQFGTVAENSTGTPLNLIITNLITNPVTITGMSISGTNAGDFSFDGGFECTGTIPVGQGCSMYMLFTPSGIGARSASLLINVQGLNSPISVPLQGTGGNPIPAVTSISPTNVYVNSPATTITINGTGFLPTSTVALGFFNGNLSSTYVSANELTAQVPASYFTQATTYSLYVTNPAPGGGESSGTNFQVIALDPTVQTTTPSSVVAGTSGAITVNGSNFMTGATVLWNGKAVPTTYVGSSELTAQPSTTQLAHASIVQLSVSNPSPGGVSAPIDFDVTFPATITVLDLPANDIVWDPFAQRIYASLPSSYGPHGNSIAVINPATGAIGGYNFAGSEPNQLALSSDSKYLYVGLNGNGSVQRLILPKFTLDIDVSLGSGEFGGLNTAGSLQVYPSDSHSWAVALGSVSCCSSGPLEFFTDSTMLPDSVSYPSVGDILFSNSTTLYGYVDNTLIQVAVNSSGGTLTTQWNDIVMGDAIQYASGLIYSSNGQVFDPTTGLLVGSFDVGSTCCSGGPQVLPDSTINRAFVVGTTPFFSDFGITTYNLTRFTPQAVANLNQPNGGTPASFIQWGKNGLAFILQSGCCGNTSSQIMLVQSPAMFASGSSNAMPVTQSISPASVMHGSWNFTATIQGSGFVPGSEVTWNGSLRSADYISPTQLKLYIPATDVTVPGTGNIVVTNPSPGGGKSTALSFSIN
jgi:hypothetical protein